MKLDFAQKNHFEFLNVENTVIRLPKIHSTLTQ